jgi:pSer/pThr/pTyr-binding forkhead associated (FHA) protein
MSASELQLVVRQERLEAAFLLHRDAAGALQVTSLDREGPLTVGRRASCDVAFEWDHEVSRTHAILERVGGEWTVSDDGLSRNGTFVNGERLRARQRLRDGDVLRVGAAAIAYRLPIEGASAATAEAKGLDAVPLSDTQRRILIALCRPYAAGGFATPASNQEVAGEVHLSLDAVKNHLRVLYQRFEIGHLAQNRKRARLAECALKLGLVTERDI